MGARKGEKGDLPHLALYEGQTLDIGIVQAIESDRVRSARVVGGVVLLADEVVPVVTVAVESAGAMALDADIVATQDPGGRLVLVAHVQRVVEPVLNVGAPLEM